MSSWTVANAGVVKQSFARLTPDVPSSSGNMFSRLTGRFNAGERTEQQQKKSAAVVVPVAVLAERTSSRLLQLLLVAVRSHDVAAGIKRFSI